MLHHFLRFIAASLLLAITTHSETAAGPLGKPSPPPVGVPVQGSPADSRLDPAIRYLVRHVADAEAQMPGTVLRPETVPWCSLLPGSTGTMPDLMAFVRYEGSGALPAIQALGGEILGNVENIATVRIPVLKAPSVADLPGVRSVQISGVSRPALDLSRAEARVDAIHAGVGGLDRPYKGAGVVVGVLDSGVDWSHPDFSAGAGNSRIRFLFDYSNGANGREWTKAEIDAGSCDAIDGPGGRGHGTHVAGTAAGGGRAQTPYIGMAPEADIVAVKASRQVNSGGGFSDADIVNGTQYIFTRAAALNEPAVVNLSLGGHFGPHDGTSLLDQSISALVGPGGIVVASAGNEGSAFIHAGYTAQAGSGYSDALETLIEPATGAQQIVVDMWYPGSPASISVGIAAYLPGNVASALAVTAAVPPGQALQNAVLQSGGTTLGTVTIDARTTADPNNGAHRVVFILEDGGAGNLASVAWSVYTFGSGTFDMWAVTGGRFTPDAGLPSYFRQGDNEKTVGSPATAKKVIAVGSYVSKNSWIDIDDSVRVQPGNPSIGAISVFSSRGPSRDGRILPHLAAPGEAIIAPLSSSLVVGTDIPRAEVLQGGGLQKLQGTSMASPHVAGVVALLLERNRYLTPENVLSLLGSTAEAVGTSPNTTWGRGKMRAIDALLATPPAIDCATLARMYGIDCDGSLPRSARLLPPYPNPFNPSTTVLFQTPRQEKVELAVYDLLGRQVRVLFAGDVGPGYHQAIWDGVTDRAGQAGTGVYFVRLRTPETSATQRILLVK